MKSNRLDETIMTGRILRALIGSSLLVTVSVPGAVWLAVSARAEPREAARGSDVGASGQTSHMRAGKNTEQGTPAADPKEMGFSISVDGVRLSGDERPVDVARATDISLSKVDIQVKFDGLDARPILNVATRDLRHSYRAGEKIYFNVTTNYPTWIKRAELRIYDAEAGPNSLAVETVSVPGIGDDISWSMPADGPDKYVYVLRVYDRQGRFDETVPLALQRTSRDHPTHETAPSFPPISAGRGEDRTAVRNIIVHGGSVTVFGRNVPDGFSVSAIGEKIPVDHAGSFVMQRILPPGDHAVDVEVRGQRDGVLQFTREIIIPENEWFYVGLADLTLGHRFGSRDIVEAGPDEYDRVYSKGRLAFYLKGKIKGRYILTAAADTGEDKVQNLFRDYGGKGPQELLRRIDPDRYYPVYGDDSTAIEDAPTDGKFYVRLERGNSHVMWGRYKTTIRGGEFARSVRKLYGAHGRYQSDATTTHGEPRYEAETYAARPGTLPQRDILQGTGGSVYFLSRQDVNKGSETITVEARDPASGYVLSRHQLRYGEDYDINYVQGVVLLKKPLSSSTMRDEVVSNGALGDNAQFLVVQYEYTPALEKVKGYSSGGRGQAWVGDNIRIGAAGLSEQTGEDTHDVVAADVHVRLGRESYVEAETARSEGPGFRSTHSLNGGLTIDENGTAGTRHRRASAHRAKAHIDLGDIGLAKKGAVGAYFEQRDAGFSSLGYDTDKDQRTYGALADVILRDDLRFKMKYKDYWNDAGRTDREGGGQIEYDWRPQWTVAVGVKHRDVAVPGTVLNGPYRTDGARTDAGARLTYKPDEDHAYYVFGQGTISRSGNISRNDRVGVGSELRVTEKVGLSGEVSYGTLGWGGLAAVNYDPTPDDRNYFGYRLDPERSLAIGQPLIGADHGKFIIGTKHKFSNSLSAFAENNYDMFGMRQTLTSTYGVVYTPTALWTVTGGVEYGDIQDRYGTGDIERVAPSVAVVYKDAERISWRLKGEARFDNSTDVRNDRTTYLAAAGLAFAFDQDWRFLTGFDAAISDSDQSSILDGDYIKGSVGYAYRPVAFDWMNALFKFIVIYDLPGPDQVTISGSKLGPAQRSFVLSADANFDINRHLTLGGKYGFRIGQVSQTRGADDFIDSSAHLGVVRADFHVVKNWDVMLEVRALHTPEIDTTNLGVVAAVYRHVGENLKVGLGYNFGRFSDDVADLTHDDGGVFVNVVGKF